MAQRAVPAAFIRGGTSKGVFFDDRDLPAEPGARDAIFLAAIGSPDPHGRQLDGMGGGVSSLSKVVVIAPSDRPGIDIDYTFGQVVIGAAEVDYGATCGNLSSAVGPFAVDEGLIAVEDGEALVRVHNTNTDKVFESRFPVAGGRAEVAGDFAIPGVAGTGARIRLDYLDPGGAGTGKLLPTDSLIDHVELPDGAVVEVSCVDATNACVFAAAADFGLQAALEADVEAMARLEQLRALAGVRMGLGATAAEVSERSRSSPKLAILAPPTRAPTLDGGELTAEAQDLTVRMVSMGQVHRAVPLTGGMCLAVAAGLDGSIAHRLARAGCGSEADLRLGTPSGALPVGARVRREGNGWAVERVVVYRTARRLMQGQVLVPESRLLPA